MTEHNNTPLISIIIPTRNRSALLSRLLASLTHVRYPCWEVLVADDGSSDDTAVVVERFRRQGLPVTYLYGPWQKMGAARNRALRRARGTIVAFTDDDCLVDPGWLTAIARAFAAHPIALGVQGRTVTNHAAMTPFTRQVEQLEGGQPYRTCNIAYRTEVVRALGGFDPHLIRGEDVVLGRRVLERGPILFAPDAVVEHPPRPKEWANRAAWRTLMESEVHFKRTYARYAPERSATLSVQKPRHVLSRWVLLPVRRYWRWHVAYFRRQPLDYLRHVPLILREKLALFSLLPYFLGRWYRARRSNAGHEYPDESPLAPRTGRGVGVRGSQAWRDCDGDLAPLVSVVVPTRNRAAHLPRLLAALNAQEYPYYQIVVVDDGSTDDTSEILRAWQQGEGIDRAWPGVQVHPQRIVLHHANSRGSYAARNTGWQRSEGEIIAFTDDDCLPHSGWLAGLVGAMRQDTVGGAQGVTVARPGEITPFTHQIEQRSPGPPYRTCNIAYRRELLEALGGFRSDLRWYADNIFGLEARRQRDIAFARDAIVHHPPRPKEWRDRATWLARFAADAEHRRYLRNRGSTGGAGSRIPPPPDSLSHPGRGGVLRGRGPGSWFTGEGVPGDESDMPRRSSPLAQIGRGAGGEGTRRASRILSEPAIPTNLLPVVLWLLRPVIHQGWAHAHYAVAHPIRYSHGLSALLRDKRELLAALREYWASSTTHDSGALPPLPAEPLVSVVVVSKGRSELAGTLAALRAQTWTWHEVIVVAHGVDLSVHVSEEARVIHIPAGPLGLARQRGVEAARGQIIAFTDDDCLPAPNWLREVVATLIGDASLWGVQGRTVADAGPPGAHAITVSHSDPLYQTCNIAYRREALERAGGFDIAFDGWFEDTALGARIDQLGPIGWAPQMLVTHQAMPRRFFDRAAWRRVLRDEQRLARRYPAFYHRTRGPGFLAVVLGRWLLGSPLKTLLVELPQAAENPTVYRRLAASLFKERMALLLALEDFLRGMESPAPSHQEGGTGDPVAKTDGRRRAAPGARPPAAR